MLITRGKEMEIFLPTSVMDAADSLLTLMEDSEETYLVPILGRPLFNYAQQEYDNLVQDENWLLPKNGADVRPVERLIRLAQEVIVYLTLANSAGLYSVSMNDAGMNTPSTQDYAASDEKRIDRFTKDAWMKGHRAIDRLLVFLEEDALAPAPEGQLFTSLWKSSRYFYRNNDTLFSTATEFNRYVDIQDNREKFVSLLPDIRYCQDTYLCPQIGYELIEVFIESLTDPEVPPTDKAQRKVWATAIRKLRTALAMYTENRNEKMQRKNSRNDADLSLERAKDYIQTHQDAFEGHIEGSPLYNPPKGNQPLGSCASSPPDSFIGNAGMEFDPNDPDNAVHSLFHFNRTP